MARYRYVPETSAKVYGACCTSAKCHVYRNVLVQFSVATQREQGIDGTWRHTHKRSVCQLRAGNNSQTSDIFQPFYVFKHLIKGLFGLLLCLSNDLHTII